MSKNKKLSVKTHINKGDTVQVISGKYKGQIGRVNQVLVKKSKIKIDSINTATKHVKPKQEGETGEIISIEKPIHSSNVMLYSNKQKMASRYNKITTEKEIKKRQLKKTNEII